MRLLDGGAKGSRIIVTTRFPSVAMAVGALKTHYLDGLSEDDLGIYSKWFAFSPENENDPKRIDLGKEIVKKCKNVPLAIRSIASLLFEKNTIKEWESIKNEELSKLGQSHEDGIMPVLKLSYNHLPSYLKQCFASCSLFPKDYKLRKVNLIYLWIAQGFIKSDNEEQTLEDISHSYFMYLLRRGFFQELETDGCDEIRSCKMHDLLVDLARHVTGGESIVLTTSSPSRSICPRHVSVQYEIDESWAVPAQLLNANGIRSYMFLKRSSFCGATLDQLFANFRLLRTLSLSWLGLKEVPNCIWELKHLRDIDLSYNSFERLPNSMTNILNLLRLVLAGCFNLKTLPDNFRKLINLRHLNIRNCDRLTYMPLGIQELTSLQYLSHFKVGKERQGVKSSGLVALAELQLKGELWIEFENGIRIPHWTAIALTSLTLEGGSKVKCIPPSRCFPNLKKLSLCYLKELQYIEEDEDENDDSFFPSLETLVLAYLPKLKQWRKDCITTTASMLFLSLSQLDITDCPELKSMPVCPRVQTLDLYDVGSALVQQLSSVSSPSTDCEGITRFSDETLTSLRQLRISNCNDLKIMYLQSSHLQEISIFSCNELTSFHVERLASLRSLVIFCCTRLKGLYISQPNVLQELKVQMCPELELWEEEKKSIDWDSFPNLSLLRVDSAPAPEMLPDCLRQRQALGKLQIFTAPE